MKVDNIRVHDLFESIVASGLPMITLYNSDVFEFQLKGLKRFSVAPDSCIPIILNSYIDVATGNTVKLEENPHFKRICKLASNPQSSGHLTALSGITVSMNITATVKWWEQWQRYHFQQIVSSQSSMHRLRAMLESIDRDEVPVSMLFENADEKYVKYLAKQADQLSDAELAYKAPMGLKLTARVTTNYLQLGNIYAQRKNHKLQEWHDFCDVIADLPLAKELIIRKEK